MKYKLKKKNILILCGLIIGLIILNYTFTYAKYVANSAFNYYLQSKEFYFGSDYLDSDGKKNINTSWDRLQIPFNVNNYIGSEQITDYDIKYEVSCKIIEGDNSKCLMNGTDTNTFNGVLSSNQSCTNNKNDSVDVSKYNKSKCEIDGYTWNKIQATKDLYFNVVSTNGNSVNDALVEVTVNSTEPYRKQIKGTFRLYAGTKTNEEIKKEYKRYTNYDVLTLTNLYNIDKCTKISFDSTKFRIDSDDLNIKEYTEDTNGYINSITMNLEKNKNYNMKIYKTNFDEIYNESSFTLINASNCQ